LTARNDDPAARERELAEWEARLERRRRFAVRVEEAARTVFAERQAELEQREAELARRERELEAERARADRVAHEQEARAEPEPPAKPEPAAPAEPEQEARPEPEPAAPAEAEPEPAAGPSAVAPDDWGDPAAGRWRFARLEAAAAGVGDPARAEELGFYLEALRPLVERDGLLPANVDPVVDEAFGDLLPR